MAAAAAVLGASLAVPGGAARATPADGPDPLRVDIRRLTPAVVPSADSSRSTVRIVGTVTNQSSEEWTDVNLHPVTSDQPITDRAALAEAAASDPATYIGDRITEAGTFDTVDSLLPGQSERFSLAIPRDQLDLPTTPGVYWLGVHAIGDSSLPRDGIADGRARAFVPQLPAGVGRPGRGPDGAGGRAPERVRTAVVVPVRAPVHHDPEGRVEDVAGWTRLLTEGGRLHDLLDLAGTSTGADLAWLVDPAVPATVAHLAAGNTARSLAPTGPGDEPGVAEEGPTPEESASEPDPAATPPDEDPLDGQDGELDEQEQAAAAAAQEWLDRFVDTMADREVLALPYGDLDVDAAAEHDPGTVATAVRRSDEVMGGLGVDAAPAITSVDGALSRKAVDLAPAEAVVLAEQSAFEAPPTTASSLVRVSGRRVLVTTAGTPAGPTPPRPDTPLALRQHLLSEAALAHLSGDLAPVVTVLPDTWHPEGASGLLPPGALRWLEAVEVGDLTSGRAPRTDAPLLRTAEQVARQLDLSAFVAASAVQGPAAVLDGILTQGSDVRAQVSDEALTTLSRASREHPQQALQRALAARRSLEAQLGSITLEAPESVTMSSATGSFAATLSNGLDQPVTVRVDAISDEDLQMAEEEVVELAPLARTRLILDVTTTRTGMHDVQLVVTDAEGRPLGSEASLPIRAARVSRIIWAIMAGGATLLFGAIAVRLVRRLRGGEAEE